MRERDDRVTKGVAAVVVTYNRRELLLRCIDCLERQSAPGLDILVIDNASTDGTGEALAPMAASGRLRYENTGKNLGGAGGFEYGVRLGTKLGYDYLWLMDDDSLPTPTALEALLKAAEAIKDFGYLSGKVLWSDGSLCRMNVQRDPMLKNLRDFSAPRIPSGAATFVSLLLPTRIVRDVGLPIGAFFIWADDLEYTRRISRRHPCYVIPASVTVHACATNNGGNIATDEPSRIERYRYAYRNEVFLYRREGVRGFFHLLLRTPLHILRVLLKSKGEKGKRIRTILGGTVDGLSFKPPVHYLD